MNNKRQKQDIEVDIIFDKKIGVWAGECPGGCEKIYAEWFSDGKEIFGYYYVDENGYRQGEFRSYFANGDLACKISYFNDNRVGLSYYYEPEHELERLYFDGEPINLDDERKYLAIQRMREM